MLRINKVVLYSNMNNNPCFDALNKFSEKFGFLSNLVSKIKTYIENVKVYNNKSLRSAVLSIILVKLSATIIDSYLFKLYN